MQNDANALKKTVLIIDDDQIVRQKLKDELTRAYYTPFDAGTGNEALLQLKSIKPDMVLLDVKLPDMDGIDLLDKIKAQCPDCEVVIITGYGGEELAIRALRNGAIDYIEKPLDMNVLLAALGRAQEKVNDKYGTGFQNVILVVDDDEAVVIRLKRFLEKEGYMVWGSQAAAEGLEIISSHRVDILITDINMQGMDGFEFLKKAKALYPDIEGIVVSGDKTGELAVKSMRVNAIDYLAKPIDLDELIFSVKKAVERISLNRSRLYRSRELKITTDIITKMNEELERKVEMRSKEISKIQTQLFQTSKLATLGEMAAGLAHEINQPLNGIAVITSTIKRLMEIDKMTPNVLASALADITESITRMKKIIEHIRTFARQEALKFETVHVPKTIDSALNLLGEQLRLHEIQVVRRDDNGLPSVQGEPYQLEQVWLNIISNARDAMDEKGEKIAAGELRADGYRKNFDITTKFNKDTEMIEVEFRDNGIGVKDETKQKVFEPFFTTKEVGKSTGLGLSISYGIVESHKGRIEFDSKFGEGTIVRVYLPHNLRGTSG